MFLSEAIIGVHKCLSLPIKDSDSNKEIQMSVYLGIGVLTFLLSNVVKKVYVLGCISWLSDFPNFRWSKYNRRLISPLLGCQPFMRRNFSSLSFENLKIKAVTPINKGCQRPVVNSLVFKRLKDVNLSRYKKNEPLGKGEGHDW